VKEDVDVYINLVETRQDFIDKIKDIDIVLSNETHQNNTKDISISDDIMELKSEIKKHLDILFEIDQKNIPFVQTMVNILKVEMKNLKTSKKVSNMYDNNIFEEYTKIDTKF